MGEMVMAGYGLDKAVRASGSFDTPCGALLRELEVRFSPRRRCALVCFGPSNHLAIVCMMIRERPNEMLPCFRESYRFYFSFEGTKVADF
jgi:hypothetical protein